MFFKRVDTLVFTDFGGFYFLYFPRLILSSRYRIRSVYFSNVSRQKHTDLISLRSWEKVKLILVLAIRKKFNDALCYGYLFLFAKKFDLFNRETFRPSEVDYLCSLGFLRLIPGEQIRLAKFSSNIHWSLLPKYRGMHPVYWAIRNAERYFGFTIHKLDSGFDSGEILLQSKFRLEDHFTIAEVNKIIKVESEKAFRSLLRAMEVYSEKAIPQESQSDAQHLKKPVKGDYLIGLDDTWEEALNKFRAAPSEVKMMVDDEEKNVVGMGSLKPADHDKAYWTRSFKGGNIYLSP